MCQQRDDCDHYGVGLVRPIEGRTFCFRECPVAHAAFVAPFLLTMNADVSFSDLPSCHTRLVRAECFLRVHWLLLFCIHTQILPKFPFFASLYSPPRLAVVLPDYVSWVLSSQKQLFQIAQ